MAKPRDSQVRGWKKVWKAKRLYARFGKQHPIRESGQGNVMGEVDLASTLQSADKVSKL